MRVKICADVPSELRERNQKQKSDIVKGEIVMSSKNNNRNQIMVPQAREAMNKFKMEAANEVGVDLKQGYNGDLTSRQAGSVGGQMVKKMIESYENNLNKE